MSPVEWNRDLRLALRLLAKNPGATALAVLSIALGIGLTTGLFAVGDAAFLRPLPVERPRELWSVNSRGDDGNLRYTTDFRSVYSTVLARWMGADPTPTAIVSTCRIGCAFKLASSSPKGLPTSSTQV